MNKKTFLSIYALTFLHSLSCMNTTPITLDSPGLFTLGGPISFALPSPNGACVVINSNDVLIDLNGFSISQAVGFEQPNTTGILINPGIQNVSISSGVVTHMTSYGIEVGDGANSIYLNNLVINDVQNAGFFANSTITGTGISNLFLTNVTTESVSNLTGAPAYGMLFKFVNSARVTGDSLVHNIQTATGDCYGFKLKDCTSMLIDNLVVNNIVGGGALTSGVFLVKSKNSTLSNCITLNNTCTSINPNAVCYGFASDTSGNIEFNTCTSIDNVCSFSAFGFYTNSSNGIQFISCQGNGNTSHSLDGIGFSANTGTLIELHNCQAKGNGGTNNGYGVFFNGLNSSAIENCDIRGNSGAAGTSYGIELINTVTSTVTNNVIAYNIGSPTTFGFFDNAGAATTNNILSNIAIKNGTNYSPGAATIPIFIGTSASFDAASPFIYQNISIP